MQASLFAEPAGAGTALPTGLRDYQQAALGAIVEAMQRGVRRQLVVMATGLGKSHTMGHVPGLLGARRTLVLAHRVEIVDQLAAHLARANPLCTVAVEQGERREATPDHDIVVASVPTLASARRRSVFEPGHFDLVMHDESHHIIAQSHRTLLQYFGVGGDQAPTLIGWTATPMRGDKQVLANVFDEVVFDKSLSSKPSPIDEGWLCRVTARDVRTDTDLRGVKTSGGDFQAGDLEAAVNTADRNDRIASAIHQHAQGRRTILVFCAGVEHARILAGRLQQDGEAADCVVGTTPDHVRRRIWRAFGKGELRIVVNVAVATEGFDCPQIDCLVMARPTKSALLYTQMLGRGMRTHPGKTDLLVLDLVDVCGRHRIRTAAELFGCRSLDLMGMDTLAAQAIVQRAEKAGVKARDGEDIASLEKRVRAKERRSMRLAMQAKPTDLFGRPVLTPTKRGESIFPWLPVSPGEYVMQIDRGFWATVQRDQRGQWHCTLTRDGQRTGIAGEALPGPDIDWHRADALVKRYAGHWKPDGYIAKWQGDHGIPRWKMLQRAAPRRQRLASPAMLEACRKWRVVLPEGVSHGTASDALAAAVWRARR